MKKFTISRDVSIHEALPEAALCKSGKLVCVFLEVPITETAKARVLREVESISVGIETVIPILYDRIVLNTTVVSRKP